MKRVWVTYESIIPSDEHTGAVRAFGVAYEKAVIAWIDDLTRTARRRPAGSALA